MQIRNLTIIAFVIGIIGLAALIATHLNLTGFAVKSENSVEKTISIEIWANSYIEFETQHEQILVRVFLDNGTLIEESEINLYLNDKEIIKNSQIEHIFNLYEMGPGTYNLQILNQGSPISYINSSSLKKQIEIKETREIIILEEKEEAPETISQISEETPIIEITEEPMIEEEVIIPSNLQCEEFKENVLWSSGYSNEPEGSVNYEIWIPKNNCSSLGVNNCFIGSIELETRFLYFEETNKQGEGFIQISNPSNEICNNPEQGIYEKYLAYETLIGESQKRGKYCGNNRNPNALCGIEMTDSYSGNSCYGIKIHGDQYFLVDAFEIKYTLCYKGDEK